MEKKPVTAVSIRMIAKITSYEDEQITGMLDSIYFKEPYTFHNIVDMIDIMETTFDALGFPDKALLPRTFGKAKERMRRHEIDLEKLIKERQAKSTRHMVPDPQSPESSRHCGLDPQSPATEPTSSPDPQTPQSDPLATFEIFVGFRLNAEWQGRLHWADRGVTKEFSSIVEMMKLLDEALKADAGL